MKKYIETETLFIRAEFAIRVFLFSKDYIECVKLICKIIIE